MMRKLSLVIGAALAAALAASAAAQDKASLRLNWYLGGLHAPFYLGKEKGFYAAEKIDLEIQEGRGSPNTVQIVAAGSATFGMADAGSLMLLRSKGAEVQAVMSLLNTSGFGVISLAETGIKTPKDLEGKTLAITAGDALTQLFPAMAKANKLDMSKIKLLQVDPPSKVVVVLEKKAHALLGGIDDQYFLIEAKGQKPAALRFADHGANTVGITILAGVATIKDKGDLVRRFVRASVKSWEEAIKNPDAAIDAALKTKPDLNRESTKKQLMADIALLESPGTKGKGIGYGAEAEWKATMDLLKEYRGLETKEPPSAFYTNAFLPK
jgi:NitT/TauT family transport system substrate-binding protein